MKSWQIAFLAVGVVAVAAIAFVLGSKSPSLVSATPKVLGLNNSSTCSATLEAISKNLNRPAQVTPCTDSTMQAANAIFGGENFNKKQHGFIYLDGIAMLSVSEFDLSIKSGQEGFKRFLEIGEQGQKPYKVAENVAVSIVGSPWMFKDNKDTEWGRKLLEEYKVSQQLGLTVPLASKWRTIESRSRMSLLKPLASN